MKFCSQCGSAVTARIPDGDDRVRFVCDSCDVIHYENPRVIVGCVPIYEDRILLCKRAIAPREGSWTLPAGFMENGETSVQGAARETWEEARAKVEQQQLYRLFDVPGINQVYMFYRAVVINGECGVGPESSEVGLFKEEDIPWDNIAFPVIYHALKEYLSDRRKEEYPIRVSSINR
ncbi:NUDIX domain-containing protein [Halieaceae bacterium IMCC14734]|uniref:NUDIX domain-containing protein n=1 Tax=Candidatus Litorirhabdus singularis TaxID=2518993 RepID=A0ABT3TFX1_9GAMM|nr:NUDIX hydrolase [Candidatus Litorirhabdus singularis]MCX2981202.1 NUDIX domain-containing protein [Candidatus Litorirhabdus singularis]